MKAGAAPADEFQLKVTRCHDEKFGFALFRHERRAGSGLLRAQCRLKPMPFMPFLPFTPVLPFQPLLPFTPCQLSSYSRHPAIQPSRPPARQPASPPARQNIGRIMYSQIDAADSDKKVRNIAQTRQYNFAALPCTDLLFCHNSD
jgi:hypothetical protein